MLSVKNITSSLACSTKSVTILAQWVLLWLFLNKWRCNLTWHELSRVILRGHTKSILIYGRQFDVSKAFLWCVWPFIRVRTFFLWKIPQIWPSVMTVQSKQAVQVKNGQPKCRKRNKIFLLNFNSMQVKDYFLTRKLFGFKDHSGYSYVPTL